MTISTAQGVAASTDAAVRVGAAPLSPTALHFSATQAQVETQTVALFADPDPNAIAENYSANISWGDGSSSTGSIIAVSQGKFAVSGAHGYEAAGSFAVTVSIDDLNHVAGSSLPANTAVVRSEADVTPSPIVIHASQPTIVAAQTAAIPEGTILATFREAGGDYHASDFHNLVDWGDGSDSVATVVPTTSGFAIEAAHQYLKSGDYTVQVVVRNEYQTTASATVLAVVNAVVPLAGSLDPESDTGVSDSDGVTSDAAPIFIGSSAPGVLIQILAWTVADASPIFIGQALSGPNGTWSIQAPRLADGSYFVDAFAKSSDGGIAAQTTLTPHGLLIDTQPPTVAAASMSSGTGQVEITIRTGLAGLDLTRGLPRNAFAITAARGGRRYTRPKLDFENASGGFASIIATFNNGRRLPTGRYTLMIKQGAIVDLAGNEIPRIAGISPSPSSEFDPKS